MQFWDWRFLSEILDMTVDLLQHYIASQFFYAMFFADQQYIWRRKNKTYAGNNTLPKVKHGSGSIMLWGCSLPQAMDSCSMSRERWIW